MSMISPEIYINFKKDKDIKELIEERNKLIKEILKYENDRIDGLKIFDYVKPSQNTKYKVNNSYLIELTKLILEKSNELKDMEIYGIEEV